MSYLVLARKYRPQKFGDLTGQQTTAQILQSAILQDRLAHAYLFSGTRGVGKTTTARIFAKAINCHKNRPSEGKKPSTAEPCDQCSSCEEITKGTAIDVLELDAASHTQVDKIREVVIDTVNFAPVRDRYKVFIIDEVHMLSHHSFNALLKTLEEPPPHVVFILATTDFHKIPLTIASRCQRYRFLPLTHQEILSNLKSIAKDNHISITDDALGILAKAAAGSMRDGLSIFDQIISHLPQGGEGKSASIDRAKVEEILGVVREDFLFRFLEKVAAHDAKGVLEAVGQLLKEGYDLSAFLKELREAFREMLSRKCGYAGDSSLAQRALPEDRFSLEEILRDIQLLTRCADQMRWNDLPQVVFECYAVRLCEDAVSAGELLQRLERLEGRLRSGGSAPAPAAPERSYEAPRSEPRPAASSAPAASAAPAPAAPEPEPAAEISGSPDAPGIEGAWQKALNIIRASKPFLYQALESASVKCHPDRIELSFSRSFSHDTAKRNLSLIESLLLQVLKRPVTVALRVAETSARPAPAAASASAPVPEPEDGGQDDEAVIDDSEEAPAESFEAVEGGASSSGPDGIPEDEGAKKFLNLFPGKVTKSNRSPA